MPGILVVDDYAIARSTLQELLRWHEMPVCGEAKDGKDAIEKVKKLKPDVVLLDVNMPVMNGMQAALEIRQISPQTKIIFLTVIGPDEAASAARLLAHGYVQKSNAGKELIPALEQHLRIKPQMNAQSSHPAD